MKYKKYKMIPVDKSQWHCHNCDICVCNISPNPNILCYIPYTYWWIFRIKKPRYFNVKIDREMPKNVKVL